MQRVMTHSRIIDKRDFSGFTEEWLRKYLAGNISDDKKRNRPQVLSARYSNFQPYKNEWEWEYAGQLELMRAAGEIVWWGYECWGFRLAAKTFHYPDFPVVFRDGHLEIHECKGHKKQAWLIKYKICREMYPFLTWRCFKKIKGRWEEIHV